MRPQKRDRRWNPVTGLLGFVLSGAMGVAFVFVVNKTHDLFADPTFEQTSIPRITEDYGSAARHIAQSISK